MLTKLAVQVQAALLGHLSTKLAVATKPTPALALNPQPAIKKQPPRDSGGFFHMPQVPFVEQPLKQRLLVNALPAGEAKHYRAKMSVVSLDE